MKKAAALSDGAVKLTTGALYRLVAQDLVVPDGEEEVGGRLWRYYRISNSGAEAAPRPRMRRP